MLNLQSFADLARSHRASLVIPADSREKSVRFRRDVVYLASQNICFYAGADEPVSLH